MNTVVDQEAAAAAHIELDKEYKRHLMTLVTPVRAVAAMFEDRDDWNFFLRETRGLLLLFKEYPRLTTECYLEWKKLKVFACKNQFSSGSPRWKALVFKRGDRASMRKQLAYLDCVMCNAVNGEYTEALCYIHSDWVVQDLGAAPDGGSLPRTSNDGDSPASTPQSSPDHPRP
jgi:hypothetical protein